ncbi:hypothetical protein ACFL2D_02020 [Patescibacteria group bacterium]
MKFSRIILLGVFLFIGFFGIASGVQAKIQGKDIANGAINSAKIRNYSIRDVDLASNSVNSSKIKNYTITWADIANYQILNQHLKTNAVTMSKMASNSVGSDELQSGAVKTLDIYDNAVTSAKIDAGAVEIAHMAANSVDTTQLVNGAVTLSKLDSNSVDTSKIVNGSVSVNDVDDELNTNVVSIQVGNVTVPQECGTDCQKIPLMVAPSQISIKHVYITNEVDISELSFENKFYVRADHPQYLSVAHFTPSVAVSAFTVYEDNAGSNSIVPSEGLVWLSTQSLGGASSGFALTNFMVTIVYEDVWGQ